MQYSASVHFCPGSYSSEVVNVFIIPSALNHYHNQRWSRGRKAREAKAKTTLSRTDPLEVKDRNARGQGHWRKCSQKKKKKRSSKKKSIMGSQKKRSRKKFLRRTPKKVFKPFFSGDLQNFYNSKNCAVLEQRTGHFSKTWGFEAKAFKMCPRGLHPEDNF